jgi:hypothetical protein
MWKLKVLTQFVLAHMPAGEKLNFVLQNLKGSHSPERIGERIFELVEILNFISQSKKLDNGIVAEIGTGWVPLNTLLLYLLGARAIYTYDHIAHVRLDLVQRAIAELEKRLTEISRLTSIPESILRDRLNRLKTAKDITSLFKSAGITYQAPGDFVNSGLPDKSVDLVYSYAVLEHVPESLVGQITAESNRILKSGGLAFHAIGLHDHYNGFDPSVSKVNFLQYPEWLWKFFIKNKISYHNRLREKQFFSIFKEGGGRIEKVRNKVDPSDLESLKTMKLDRRFQGMSPEELAVTYSEVLLSFN